ncbi:MAG: hypothetical protein MAG431_02314 [Chloroflexi bacterium]|nr:hypothetical protein [Chloroflexota bacterium]
MQSNPLLDKTERFIRSAQLLAEDGDLDSAASRLYYSMFYIAEVLLDAIGLSFSSHRAVMSAYGQHFAKTGELDSRFHQALISAFSQRQLGDYQANSGLEQEDIELMLTNAKDFLAASRKWLDKTS